MQDDRVARKAQWMIGGVAALAAVRMAAVFSRRFDYRGKRVLLTGGSRGLGLVLARKLLAQGARLTLCARHADALASAERELKSLGGELAAVCADVTNEAEVTMLVNRANERFGGVDVLINNAGTIEVGPLQSMTLADFDAAMKTHFWGPLYTTLKVLPGMRRRRWGRIVNISSIGGKIAVPHLLPYSASKFALVGLSEGLAAEVRRDNIFVTTVCPGLMRTGSPRNALFKGQHRKEFAWFDLGDAFPASSMNAQRAAGQILRACQYGQAQVILSVQARAAALAHDLFPNLAVDLAAWANRLLPGPGGIGAAAALGRDSESALTRSPLTLLDRSAAAANNQ